MNQGHSWNQAMENETLPLVKTLQAADKAPKQFLWMFFGGCNVHRDPEEKVELLKAFQAETNIEKIVSVANQTYDYGEGFFDASLVGLEVSTGVSKIDWHPCHPQNTSCSVKDAHYQSQMAWRCRTFSLSSEPQWQNCCPTEQKDEDGKLIWEWSNPQPNKLPQCATSVAH